MDDAITDDQRILVDASARMIGDTCPLEKVRENAYGDESFAAAYRRKAADIGWYSLLVPEALGGGNVSGNGVLDTALVAYQRGRLLQPGAFVGTNVVAYALAVAGNDRQRESVLPALMAGEVSAAWVVTDSPGAPIVDGIATATANTTTGGGYRLSGTATFVEDPGPDGWFLVAAAAEDGPAQFLVPASDPGLRVQPLGSLDLTRRFVALEFDALDVPASARVGSAGGAADLIESLLALACLLTTAESVGAMDYELALTVQYAKDRVAFGRPIGSFQAVKHSLADTSLLLEMSKAITLAAAAHVGDADGYGLEAASMAKAFVGDCGIDLAQACFQTFGGIGFTWEHDQHLYLRRLTSDAALFGDPAWHRERLCQLAGI